MSNTHTTPGGRSAALDALLEWEQAHRRPLPLPPELIVSLEAQGHTVDLETGRIALWGAVRPLGLATPLPHRVALAVLNLVESLELKHAKEVAP